MQSLYHMPHPRVITNQAYHRPTQNSMVSLTPPFQSGEFIRPRAPWHPWRLYQIMVEECHRMGEHWLLEVHIQNHKLHDAKVLADDFEQARKPALLSRSANF